MAIKRTRASYNLIKWDVCRKLEDQRAEAEYLKKRRQKSMKFMIALAIVIKLLKKNCIDFEEHMELK